MGDKPGLNMPRRVDGASVGQSGAFASCWIMAATCPIGAALVHSRCRAPRRRPAIRDSRLPLALDLPPPHPTSGLCHGLRCADQSRLVRLMEEGVVVDVTIDRAEISGGGRRRASGNISGVPFRARLRSQGRDPGQALRLARSLLPGPGPVRQADRELGLDPGPTNGYLGPQKGQDARTPKKTGADRRPGAALLLGTRCKLAVWSDQVTAVAAELMRAGPRHRAETPCR